MALNRNLMQKLIKCGSKYLLCTGGVSVHEAC